ncbi:MAG: hypothetical protein Q8769_01815 [Candidatus Phytoplasma australasiaticum]|nr:hypothetical protein [Candidatus Phytoplasma australasiaticum]
MSFADFTKSILADMARIATRQASSALLSSLVGAAQEFINDKVFDKFQLKDKHVIVLPNQLGTRVNLLFNKLI